MGAPELAALSDSAAEIEATDPAKAVEVYREGIFGTESFDAETVKVKELAVDRLAKLFAAANDAQAVKALLTDLRPLFKAVPKAKTAKIVRGVIDALATMHGCDLVQVEVCEDMAVWARSEQARPAASRSSTTKRTTGGSGALLRSEISRQSARRRKPSVNIANGLRAFAKTSAVWGYFLKLSALEN